MSGIVKSVKKVFKKVGKAVKKIAKSKIFKAILIGAAIYFGGAGIASMMKGGTFMTGVASAGSSLSAAGTSLMNGQFSTAASTIGNSWGTAGAAGAAQASTVAANAAIGATSTVVPGAPSAAGLQTQASTGLMQTAPTSVSGGVGSGISATPSVGLQTAAMGNPAMGANMANVGGNLGAGAGTTLAGSSTMGANMANVGGNLGAGAGANAAAGMSHGAGLMYSAGINAGTQAVGGYMNAKSQEEMAEEDRKRRSDNTMGKRYGSGFDYDIQSAFPETRMG